MTFKKSALFLFIAILLVSAGCKKQAQTDNEPKPTPQTLTEFPGKTIKVKQSVSIEGKKTGGTFTVPEGQDALRLLQTFRIVTAEPDTGRIISIEGTVADSSKVWVLYVNGKKGAQYNSLYNPKDGDTLDWKLEYK